MQHEDEVPEEFIQAAEETAELAQIAAEKSYELVQVRAIQADADLVLPIVRQMRELLPVIAEYQSAWLRELAPALAIFQSAQLGAIVSTLQSALPTLIASQQWAEINRSIAEMVTGLSQTSAQAGLASGAGRAQLATITVQPVVQNPAADTPVKVTATPQARAKRDEQVIPPWLWVLALAAVSFAVAAAEDRLSPVVQITVNSTITWFGLLLTIYALSNIGKR